MNGLFFYIGLGAGLAAACGMRPFLPLLLAGALASAGVLGVDFGVGSFKFLEEDWWLLVVAVALGVSYILQLVVGMAAFADPKAEGRAAAPLASAIVGLGWGAGAVLFAGTLADHHDAWWPGLVGGLAIAALAQQASGPVIAGARTRLPDRAAREALTVYLDAASLVLAAVVALVHPLGYVAVVALAWFVLRRRSRSGQKYAGLRILRR
ncbi:MAG: DUF4126 family protein [Solirubrobacteraceae bacterium]